MKVALNAIAQVLSNPSGMLSYLAQLTKYFPIVDSKTEYSIISDADSCEYYRKKSNVTQVIAAPWGNENLYRRLFMDHALVGGLLKKNAVDVLFQPGAGVAPLRLPGNVTLVLGVYAMHHLSEGQLPPHIRLYRSLFFDRSLRRAQYLVVNSEYSRNILRKHLGDDRREVAVIHHGVNGKLFHDAPLTDQEDASIKDIGIVGPYILFVSKIYMYKRIDLLVDAFCRFVKKTGAPHRLVIIGHFSETVGGGKFYQSEVVSIAERYQLADRLVMIDAVAVRVLRPLYVRAEVYVQSSVAETFGRTTIEAMACGCPVLAADAAATPEIVGDAGVLYPPDDVDACTLGLERLCSDPDLRADLRRRGLKRVQAFSFQQEVAKLAHVFRQAHDTG